MADTLPVPDILMDIRKGVAGLMVKQGLVAMAIVGVALMLGCSQGGLAEGEGGRLYTDFSFTLYQGEDVMGADDLLVSDLLDKPTVVNFWAGLCPPCREEMPHFQEFYDEFATRINFVGVDVGQFTAQGTIEDARKLLGDLGITYPAGYTEDSEAVKAYVLGIPTTVFITPEGAVFRSWAGYLSREKLTEITEEMIESG